MSYAWWDVFLSTDAPPAAPANPAAVAISTSQIDVSWDNVAGETGFRVERSLTGVGGWADVSGNLPADTLSFSSTGLTCNTTYYYRIIAFNDGGDGTPSAVVSATTNACPPGPPASARKVLRSPRYGLTRSNRN